MTPRLKTQFDKDIVKNLMTKLNYSNKHQVPKLVKIILNIGLGEDASDNKKMKVCLEVCKTYSSEPLEKKENHILDTVPFDDGQKN